MPRIVAAPDGAVNRTDRALWMTPAFDIAATAPRRLEIVAAPDSAVNRADRALWMTPPFQRAFQVARLEIVAAPDAAVDRLDRALWMTPPFQRPLGAPAAGSPSAWFFRRYIVRRSRS